MEISVTAIVPGLMRTGSHIRVKFKGNRENEISLVQPRGFASRGFHERHAAYLIVKAARERKAQSIFPWNALLAAKIHAPLPNSTASLLSLVPARRRRVDGGRDIRPCGESYLEKAAKIPGT